MKKLLISVLMAACGFAIAETFTDVNTANYWGKTSIPKLTAALDGNFTLIESGGTLSPSFDAVTINNALTAVSTNDATTNIVINVDAELVTTTLSAGILPSDVVYSNEAGQVTCSNVVAGADGLDPADLAGGTVPADVVFTEATVDGKYAVVGGDATTGLMIQKAAVTAGAGALETNTFAVAFGAAPIVTCTYTEDPGDVRPIFVTDVTASNFVANITADKNYGYIAVGSRP